MPEYLENPYGGAGHGGHPVRPAFSHAVLYHLPFQALFQPYMFLEAIIWQGTAARYFLRAA